MGQFAPRLRISSIIDNWAPYCVVRAGAVMKGIGESRDTWDGIGAGMVEIGEMSDEISAHIQAEAKALQGRLASGVYHAFTDPLTKQNGSPWLAAGETADDRILARDELLHRGSEW